jgi:glucose/arabinose dehydrogenase
MKIAPAVGWADGQTPDAAPGFVATALVRGLDHPRWLYVLPNGDVLIAETNAPPKPEDGKGLKGWFEKIIMGRAGATVPSANRITLVRDADNDGTLEARTTFLSGLNSPFGMALVGDTFYVADSDALLAFPYQTGQTQITAAPRKVADLPAGPINHHWTKNVIASPDGSKLYVTVGSNSNVGENGMANEDRRAAILEIDPATGASRVFASGLRNPNGMGWQPTSGALWTSVNERDEIGNDLVPDYMTSVKDGGFYGWPYSYYGQTVGRPREAPAAGPGGQGDQAGLRPGRPHRLAGPDLLRRRRLPGPLQGRGLHRPARLVEPQARQRLSRGLRAVRERHAVRSGRAVPDRLPGRQGPGPGPPGRRGGRQVRRPAGGRRRRQRTSVWRVRGGQG